jgi:hypothetical protein
VNKEAKAPATKTWRPTPEDIKLMGELKAHFSKRLGLTNVNDSDVVRMGLNKLAEAEGLR